MTYHGFSTKAAGAFMQPGIYSSRSIDVSHIISSYATIEVAGANDLVLNDLALVQRNLLDHLFTRKFTGRVMMPKFGTILDELLFEQMDDDAIASIKEEIEQVIAYDPRVALVSINVIPQYDENQVIVYMDLQYIELNLVAKLEFDINFK